MRRTARPRYYTETRYYIEHGCVTVDWMIQSLSKHYLNVVEKNFGPSAVEGVNAGTGRAAPAALKAEQIGVESIASQGSQRPTHWNFPFLVQDQIRVADFQLAST